MNGDGMNSKKIVTHVGIFSDSVVVKNNFSE